ncbi:MAG: helix-turn-helix domain-containing protein, partial [Nitrospirota bacterium]
RLLAEHAWPGNVRELEHALEHAVILARSEVLTLEDLPQDLRSSWASLPGANLEEQERLQILRALETERWNKTRAARTLGMSRPTLYQRMKKYNLE